MPFLSMVCSYIYLDFFGLSCKISSTSGNSVQFDQATACMSLLKSATKRLLTKVEAGIVLHLCFLHSQLTRNATQAAAEVWSTTSFVAPQLEGLEPQPGSADISTEICISAIPVYVVGTHTVPISVSCCLRVLTSELRISANFIA